LTGFLPPTQVNRFVLQSVSPVYEPDKRTVLLSTDVDETLIPWLEKRTGFDAGILRRNVAAINKYKPSMAVHLNTGKALSSFQQAMKLVQPLLKRLPVDYLSLNNGQELYINQRHERADQWIAGLQESHAQSSWAMDIEQMTGWCLPKVAAIRAEIFQKLGYSIVDAPQADAYTPSNYRNTGIRTFRKQEKGHTYIIQAYDNQSGWRFAELVGGDDSQSPKLVFDEKRHKKLGLMVSQAVQAEIARAGIAAESGYKTMTVDQAHYGVYTLLPRNINKGAVVEHLLSLYFEAPKAVITAGDDVYNDGPLLLPKTFKVKGSYGQGYHRVHPGQRIRNYPILMLGNEKMEQRLRAKHNVRAQFVPIDQLSDSLDRQMKAIRQQSGLKLNRFA
jgi:hydroxymethylpyrimidine pyrophosphatase-like HAD family hydrolase